MTSPTPSTEKFETRPRLNWPTRPILTLFTPHSGAFLWMNVVLSDVSETK